MKANFVLVAIVAFLASGFAIAQIDERILRESFPNSALLNDGDFVILTQSPAYNSMTVFIRFYSRDGELLQSESFAIRNTKGGQATLSPPLVIGDRLLISADNSILVCEINAPRRDGEEYASCLRPDE